MPPPSPPPLAAPSVPSPNRLASTFPDAGAAASSSPTTGSCGGGGGGGGGGGVDAAAGGGGGISTGTEPGAGTGTSANVVAAGPRESRCCRPITDSCGWPRGSRDECSVTLRGALAATCASSTSVKSLPHATSITRRHGRPTRTDAVMRDAGAGAGAGTGAGVTASSVEDSTAPARRAPVSLPAAPPVSLPAVALLRAADRRARVRRLGWIVTRTATCMHPGVLLAFVVLLPSAPS